jgi:hypothetical protein
MKKKEKGLIERLENFDWLVRNTYWALISASGGHEVHLAWDPVGQLWLSTPIRIELAR